MTRTLEAVHEGGLLRPLEPLLLKEHQKVTVTVVEAAEDPLAPHLDSISTHGLGRYLITGIAGQTGP